jgi:hypothetical protein
MQSRDFLRCGSCSSKKILDVIFMAALVHAGGVANDIGYEDAIIDRLATKGARTLMTRELKACLLIGWTGILK